MAKYFLFLALNTFILVPIFGQTNINSRKTEDLILMHRHSAQARGLNRYSGQQLKSANQEVDKLDSIVAFNFNEEEQQWNIPFRKESHYYNKDSQLSLYLYSGWNDENQNWEGLMKEEYQYNSQGNLEWLTIYTKGVNTDWAPMYKDFFTYNELNQEEEITSYYWSYATENDWKFSERTALQYNANDQLEYKTVYWKLPQEGWIKHDQSQYFYDNGAADSIVTSTWDEINANWIETEKLSYVYHPTEGFLVAEYAYDKDEVDNSWIKKEAFVYVRNKDKQLVERNQAIYDEQGDKLTKQYKHTYVHDFSVEMNTLLLPDWYTFSYPNFFHHQVDTKSEEVYDFSDSRWRQYRELKYFYSPKDVSTNLTLEEEENFIKIYPNPANDYVIIDWNNAAYHQVQLQIYDLSAHKVLEQQCTRNSKVELAGLKPGIYIYQLIGGATTETGKIIIER